jgi:hypothetical protein
MKRSEFLKKAQEKLGEYTKTELEQTLEVFQELGMLPPTIEEESFVMLESGEMVYNVNEWENEEI